jgi:hypothetical protein
MGNMQLFLIQMLALFAGAQAVTEALKQTMFYKTLVHAKKHRHEITSKAEAREEAFRQSQVRRLAGWSGAILAFIAQINPLKTLTDSTLTSEALKFGTHYFGAGIATNLLVLVASVLTYVAIGFLAVYGAPLFNELLVLVTTLRENATNVTGAMNYTQGQPMSAQLQQLLTSEMVGSSNGTMTPAAAQAILANVATKAAAAVQPPAVKP